MIKTPKENMIYIKFLVPVFFKTFGFETGETYGFNAKSKKHEKGLTIQKLPVEPNTYSVITELEYNDSNKGAE